MLGSCGACGSPMQYEMLSRGAPGARGEVESCHDGTWRMKTFAGSTMMGSLSAQIMFVPAAKRDGVFIGRRMRKLACATAGPPHDSSSRRFLHKRQRHQQPPFKGFPASYEGEPEAHRNHLERQKVHAFDFSCGDEEPSASPHRDAMGTINNHSDEYWSARILTELGLTWWSLQYLLVRLDHWLALLLLHPRQNGRQKQMPKNSRQELQDYRRAKFKALVTQNGHQEPAFLVTEKTKGLRSFEVQQQCHALVVAVDVREAELIDDGPWYELDQALQRQLKRQPKKLKLFLNQATRLIGRLDLFEWLGRLRQTYGTSFMFVVFLGYCTQGFRCFPWLAMTYFFKDNLQVDPGTMQFLISTAMLPMIAKPVYGLISDSVYIRGAHRVPYLIIAGALQLVSWGAIVMHPGASSSITVLTSVLTLSNMGAAISEVMNDALVAEAGKRKGARQGELQSLAWLALAMGGLVGNLMGGFALQHMEPSTMFSIFMMLVGAQLLLCLTINEASFGLGPSQDGSTSDVLLPAVQPQEKATLLPQRIKRIHSGFGYKSDTVGTEGLVLRNTKTKRVNPMPSANVVKLQKLTPPAPKPLGMRGQFSMLSEVLRKPEVYRPLMWFLSSYAVIPGMGSSMFFYQTQHLGLGSSVVGLVKVVGQAGLFAGSILYNRNLKKVPLRKLFGGVQVLLALCMLSDVLLVNRVNLQLGIPDATFVLGASAFVEALAQFKILPFMVLLAQLCPPGSEGSVFAFFMSAQCLACTVSAYLGVGLASYLHISANSFNELPRGIVIQALFALLPVLWINFIPEEESKSSSSPSPHRLLDEKSVH